MSDALDYVRNNCGIAGEEVAEMVDSLERQRDEMLANWLVEEPLRRQIAVLKQQRDEAEADKLETYQRLCDSRAKHKAALEQRDELLSALNFVATAPFMEQDIYTIRVKETAIAAIAKVGADKTGQGEKG